MNPHVSRGSGFDQGFETFASQARWENGHNEEVTRAVIMDLARAPRDRPLFLYLHYLDPHDPWHPEEACKARLSAGGITNRAILEGQAFFLSGESDIEDLAESSETPRAVSLSPTEKAYLEGLYECEISMVDAAVGELLGYLADERWLQDALVMVTADHGEEFWEHGMMRHGYQLFEETVRVPLIVKPPASRTLAGDPDTRLVQLVDLPATIFDLVGIEAAAEDGTSLFQPALPDRSAGAFGMTAFRNQHQAFLVEDHLKVIDDFERDRCLLFDLEADPAERQPTDCEASDPGRRMQAELEAAKESQTATALAPDEPSDEAALEEDDVLRQRLEELGYVQ
jgi:arylsulfatase A-like enzyme